jgi:hypothetical protein
MEGFGSSIVVCHRIVCHPARVAFPNIWLLFLVLPIVDVLFFGRWTCIFSISCFSVYLRDRDNSVASRIHAPQIRAYDALARTKRLPEYVSCDVLARIRTMLLNQLMGTAGRAQNPGWWGNEVGAQ